MVSRSGGLLFETGRAIERVSMRRERVGKSERQGEGKGSDLLILDGGLEFTYRVLLSKRGVWNEGCHFTSAN